MFSIRNTASENMTDLIMMTKLFHKLGLFGIWTFAIEFSSNECH